MLHHYKFAFYQKIPFKNIIQEFVVSRKGISLKNWKGSQYSDSHLVSLSLINHRIPNAFLDKCCPDLISDSLSMIHLRI